MTSSAATCGSNTPAAPILSPPARPSLCTAATAAQSPGPSVTATLLPTLLLVWGLDLWPFDQAPPTVSTHILSLAGMGNKAVKPVPSPTLSLTSWFLPLQVPSNDNLSSRQWRCLVLFFFLLHLLCIRSQPAPPVAGNFLGTLAATQHCHQGGGGRVPLSQWQHHPP